MSISGLLVPELELETRITRITLERVPLKPDFAPHEKSMSLGKLAAHIAQLGRFGHSILSLTGFDFATAGVTPLRFESSAQLVQVFDTEMKKVNDAVRKLTDTEWTGTWTLSYQGKKLFEGLRFLAYRQMFLNHLIHHRAQLGVYLRLNDVPLPMTYGPSADETMAF